MADCVPNAAELVEELKKCDDCAGGYCTEACGESLFKIADFVEALMQKAVEDDATIALIRKKAEDEIEALLVENAKLKAERDAAVADLRDSGSCYFCKHIGETDYCERGCRWEWRGVQKEENDVSKT